MLSADRRGAEKTRGILKNSGKKIFIAGASLLVGLQIIFSAASFANPPIQAETSIDPSEVAAGESALLTVKISGSDGDIEPAEIPDVPGLSISYIGISTSVKTVNMNVWKGIEIRFSVTPSAPGLYKIPPIRFTGKNGEILSRGVELRAVKQITGKNDTAAVIPVIEISANSVYLGEPLIVRYFLIVNSYEIRFEGFEKIPEIKGFIVKKIEEGAEDSEVNQNGVQMLKRHIAAFAVSPISEGPAPIGGGIGIIQYPSNEGFFQTTRRAKITFPSKPVRVKPFPKHGKPAGFSGAVGSFKITADPRQIKIRAGSDARITVTVSGTGNLYSPAKPVFENTAGHFKILTEDNDPETKLVGASFSGEKKFIVTVIPDKPGKIDLGNVSLTFLNPSTGKYETAASGPVLLDVIEGDNLASATDCGSNKIDPSGEKTVDHAWIYPAAAAAFVSMLAVFIFIREKRRLNDISTHAAVESVPAGPTQKIYSRALKMKIKAIISRAADYLISLKILEPRARNNNLQEQTGHLSDSAGYNNGVRAPEKDHIQRGQSPDNSQFTNENYNSRIKKENSENSPITRKNKLRDTYERQDYVSFLSAASKEIALIEFGGGTPLSPHEITSIKDAIYNIKYGGMIPTHEKIDSIYQTLMKK